MSFDVTYRVIFVVFLGIDACTPWFASTHGLIPILAKMKRALVFIPMYALDHFRSHETTFCHDALEADHPIEQQAAQCSRIACIFTETPGICNIVHCLLVLLEPCAVRNRGNYILQGSIKRQAIVEGLIENAVCKLM